MNEVAFHCKLLHEAGFVSDYGAQYGDNKLLDFGVGSLTWNGCEFLDEIRDNTVWGKTKNVIKEKGLPMAIETIKMVATAFVSAAAEGVANAILKNGGAI